MISQIQRYTAWYNKPAAWPTAQMRRIGSSFGTTVPIINFPPKSNLSGMTRSGTAAAVEVHRSIAEAGKAAELLLDSNSDSIYSKQDHSGIHQAIGDFAAAYNTMLRTVQDEKEELPQQILHNMSCSLSIDSDVLQSIGVSVQADGTLEVDSQKFEMALTNDFARVQSMISGREGIASAVSEQVKAIEYVPASVLLPSVPSIFVPPLFDQQPSRYYHTISNMMYTQAFTSGTMLDTYL
ncbi:flagellar hook-associated protein [Aneurinibacillus soli]|uniref:Flagellar capping protein n=1 Tax=Aneurinibacillus soli TaxID=1500254 RepID=A0A0U5B515_9BACL|nr:flagellar filament capping protein FliD [Aneurinibacillus soli]PYE58480.1 flagellar hook-associated protein [Aneurinibacillus soli]BAU29456.1 flagellar capping protein [Aneurinibacillus soli]